MMSQTTEQLNEHLKPALSDIARLIRFRGGSTDELRVRDASVFDGWVDGTDNESNTYLAIFDKRYKKGRYLAELFDKSVRGRRVEFIPKRGFRISGSLLLYKQESDLAWAAVDRR